MFGAIADRRADSRPGRARGRPETPRARPRADGGPPMGDDRTMTDGPRTFRQALSTVTDLVAAKAGRTVTVCVPARNEERTIAAVVGTVLATHGPDRGSGLVDEVLVVDDGSTDDTAGRPGPPGPGCCAAPGPGGKGRAMAAGLEAATGDLVVFLDADVENTSELSSAAWWRPCSSSTT